jgi:hypothetical protein
MTIVTADAVVLGNWQPRTTNDLKAGRSYATRRSPGGCIQILREIIDGPCALVGKSQTCVSWVRRCRMESMWVSDLHIMSMAGQ